MPSGPRSTPAPTHADPRLTDLIERVQANPKYAHIAPELVRSLAQAALAQTSSTKRAFKATRAKLHQVAGAYFRQEPTYAAWLTHLRAATSQPAPSAVQDTCRRMMELHASTRERLHILDCFYPTLLHELPPVESVLDLACGLNPLAIPWMPLAPHARYIATDIYSDLAAFLSKAIPLLGVRGHGSVLDLLHQPPSGAYDVVLLLKAFPCLEQLQPGLPQRLLQSTTAKTILVSYPVSSLGGRAKGMADNYARHFRRLALPDKSTVDEFRFETELVYRITQPQDSTALSVH